MSLVVTLILSLANLAAFSYFLNFNSGYPECWAASDGNRDEQYGNFAFQYNWDTRPYTDMDQQYYCPKYLNCHNVSWDFRSVSAFGIFFSLWWLIFGTLPYCCKPCKKNLHCCDCVSYFMSFLFLISVTIYRFRWGGRVCSGDYVDDKGPDDYEIE